MKGSTDFTKVKSQKFKVKRIHTLEYQALEENGKWIIHDVKKKYAVDLRARLFKFAIDPTLNKLGKLYNYVRITGV